MNKQEFYRQIILDHYRLPQNKVDIKPEGYEVIKGINPSCGDELELYVKIQNDEIVDIKWNGEGCSICCSSTSIMINEMKKQENKKIIKKIDNFEKLIFGNKIDDNIFEDAIAFEGIANFPARFKCAFLSWKTLKEFIDKYELK